MPSLSQYIAESEKAIRYVKSIVTVGATNSATDITARGGLVIGLVVNGLLQVWRHQVTEFEVNELNTRKYAEWGKFTTEVREYPSAKEAKIFQEVQRDAALLYNQGNCAEQSALAFDYLMKNKVAPLDWVQVKDGNHAFVVLGRDSSIPFDNFSEWTTNSIVCDPWGYWCGPAAILATRYNVYKFQSILRWEG